MESAFAQRSDADIYSATIMERIYLCNTNGVDLRAEECAITGRYQFIQVDSHW